MSADGIQTNDSTDVLVIGAGPAGLMAAIILARMNVKVKIIDRRIPGETSGQADGIQPRMLEIWQSLGIGESLRQQSEHVYRIVNYKPNASKDGIELKTQALNIPLKSARYQYEILARIDIIEGILRDELLKHGVSVEYLAVPSSMEILQSMTDEFPVKMNISFLDQGALQKTSLDIESRSNPALTSGLVNRTESISTKFVIGCDGGKSWTRKQLNIEMQGGPTNLHWGVIDFTPITNFPTPRAKNIMQSPTVGAMGWLPRPSGAARAYVMLGEGEQEVVHEVDAVDTVSKILQKGFAPYKIEIKDPTHCAVFRVNQLVAEKFSGHGRIFIAGDACHTHSPKAGQGANASMSDTFNLAWKIGYAVNRWAKQDILDTYEDERKPHSIALIELDRKIFKLFTGQTITPEEYTSLWQQEILFTSGIGLQYSSTLIDPSGQFQAGKLVIGERLPSLEVVRSSDWRPFNIHDISSFNGKYTFFICPGDISTIQATEALQSVSEGLASVIKRHPILGQFIQVNILINNETSLAVETMDLPLTLVDGDHGRVFFTLLSDNQGLYQKLELGQALILARPDNHVAAVATLDGSGLNAIEQYFTKFLP